MDLLPTMAALAGASLPPNRKIDGHDIRSLLAGQPRATTPYDAFFYYRDHGLEAVRSGPWKLHFPHAYRTLSTGPDREGQPGQYRQASTELALYNLAEDVAERHNVADQHPDLVARLQQLADAMRDELGDSLTGRQGSAVRPAGWVDLEPED
jgi:arylsulfatase A-like enzyme